MNPAEAMLGPVCGVCTRKNHAEVAGGGGKTNLTPFTLRLPQRDYKAEQRGGHGIVYVHEATGMSPYDGMGWMISAVKDRRQAWDSEQGNHGPFPTREEAEAYAREHANEETFWTRDTEGSDYAAMKRE